MKILQINFGEFRTLVEQMPGTYLVVESQPFGQPTDMFFHIVCSDEIADKMLNNFLIRPIADKGRTPGLWQNFGGSGVFQPAKIIPGSFRPELEAALRKKGTPRPLFEGKTWKEILTNVPLPDAMKVKLGVYEHSL